MLVSAHTDAPGRQDGRTARSGGLTPNTFRLHYFTHWNSQMTDGNTSFAPLSPPSSPRMSAYSADPAGSEWQDQGKPLDPSQPSPTEMAMMQADVSRPMLRTHKSFPYTLRTSGSSLHGANTPDSTGASQISTTERIQISNIEEIETTGEMPTVTYGGSAPASPVSRLTPPSPSDNKMEEMIEEDALEDEAGSGDQANDEQKPMTAQELRAQKRKMKRFRLTHNQTRFLMSEFARQAHPDAAHRERLAREIPGLSPRQVQVWFQNRRAKLKRLTSEDRDRMMRSRALPDDFDMTQALHSPFGTPGHGVGTPLSSPSTYTPSFPEGNMIRPLSIDTLRRVPDHMSPAGISPAFGGFTFTPPQSATDSLSPVSASPETFQFPPAPVDASPRRANPFAGSITSGPGPYASHPNIPRLQLHDRIGRSRAESLHSPLRTSMTYDGNMNGSDPAHSLDSPLDGPQRTVLPYGLGYSYAPIPGFQASQRMRSYSGGVPRRIELSTASHQYTSQRSNTISTPQTATFPNFGSSVSSPLGPPQNFQVPHMSAPHHITSFPNSYMRNDGSPQGEQYSVGSVLGEVVESQGQEGSVSPGHY